MELKTINDCGIATVEIHCDEMLFLAALIRNPGKFSETTGMAICSGTVEEFLRVAGITAKLITHGVDCGIINTMLVTEPAATVKEYYTDNTKG
jgi:hypothetical protein